MLVVEQYVLVLVELAGLVAEAVDVEALVRRCELVAEKRVVACCCVLVGLGALNWERLDVAVVMKVLTAEAARCLWCPCSPSGSVLSEVTAVGQLQSFVLMHSCMLVAEVLVEAYRRAMRLPLAARLLKLMPAVAKGGVVVVVAVAWLVMLADWQVACRQCWQGVCGLEAADRTA